MPNSPKLTEQEWSHFFDVDDLEKKPTELTIEASEDECADLARRFAVVSIEKATAKLKLSNAGGHVIHVQGRFECDITQECVVTLDPVQSSLSEPVEGWFADRDTAVSFANAKKEREVAKSHAEVEILDEKEDPEPVVEGRIDLGELVAQHISLAIPTYPHKEGVEYEVGDDNLTLDEKSPLRKNPFEALKDWKENR